MGEEANFDIRLVGYGDELDVADHSAEWVYDAFGRKLCEVVVIGGVPDSFTMLVWDGRRLLAEVDMMAMMNGDPSVLVAEYVPGPGYIDDIVASRRDANGDGDFDADEQYFHLTDQQYSTVGLLDSAGNLAERYGYDAFGAPSFYDAAGASIGIASALGNAQLYTGRTWLPGPKLYDYRNRAYDPATGRFLSRDPAHDPANLGNPYTYVGNNPGAFVDPFGLSMERIGEQGWWGTFFGALFGSGGAPAPARAPDNAT